MHFDTVARVLESITRVSMHAGIERERERERERE